MNPMLEVTTELGTVTIFRDRDEPYVILADYHHTGKATFLASTWQSAKVIFRSLTK